MPFYITLKASVHFAFLGLVLQTDDDSNVRVKMERWNEDPKQVWIFVPAGNKEQ